MTVDTFFFFTDHVQAADRRPADEEQGRPGGYAAVPEERHLLLPHRQGKLAGPPERDREHSRLFGRGKMQH